jgi:hypothetical protein
VIRAHQPGSEPVDIPEVIPNPAIIHKETPAPTETAPAKPAETPEKVPADTAYDSVGEGVEKSHEQL